ncbi:hypothetical protein COB55_05550 [Candidatus Wolfebacteria bacterium]|nr:MAG: hypothetical protein COB55_05550 [Candidatus Wolfebacteria bacterium]
MKHKIITGIGSKDGGWIIDKTLKVASQFSDKIIVLDDGSTDNTKEICLSYDKVEFSERRKHDWVKREEGLQRQELIDLCSPHEPSYILWLDVDEIPCNRFLKWMENIDENINMWGPTFVNLWGSEDTYRVDSYRTSTGANMNWDPFSGGRKKGILMKYDSNIDYFYNTNIERGPVGENFPSPENCPFPHSYTDDWCIIHYGKLDPYFMSGEKNKMYAKQDEYVGRREYNLGVTHHERARLEGDPTLVEVPEEWKWDVLK